MIYLTDISTENMAEKIRSTDIVTECAKMLRQSLKETDFDLQDKFYDASDLETSWKSMNIPEPLLNFLSVLYNFDPCDFKETDESDGSNDESDDDSNIDEETLVDETSKKCVSMARKRKICHCIR